MKKALMVTLLLFFIQISHGQDFLKKADSLKGVGLLKPALANYKKSMTENPSRETAYRIATTSALLWNPEMRDTAFYFLSYAIQFDQNLSAMQDPSFLSLISDPRWDKIEELRIRKYERNHPKINNPEFAKELFKMIMKNQGFIYVKQIGFNAFSHDNRSSASSSLYTLLGIEERKLKEERTEGLINLLGKYGWPTAVDVSSVAVNALVEMVMTATDELAVKCYPYVTIAFNDRKIQSSVYAYVKDKFLIAKGRKQRFGTQVENRYGALSPFPIQNPAKVDKIRKRIGLGPLKPYLEEAYKLKWQVTENDCK